MSGDTQTCQIQLLPLGKTLVLPRGAALRESLFEYGVEFPCGGRGRCKGCRLRVLAGGIPITSDDRQRLSPEELEAGWRLACRAVVANDVTLEIAQWETAILEDQSQLPFQPRPGLGVAVDLGTTTLAVQLLDLATGNVLAVATAMNGQAVHGADVMSRIHFAVHENGAARLRDLIRRQIGDMIAGLLREAMREEAVVEVVLVGNTAMHHLFCDRSVLPLAQAPFESDEMEEGRFTGADLGWAVVADAEVRFLPGMGGFVGSDVLAGVLATGLAGTNTLGSLIDLGTNGEIVVTDGARVLCASTAAGPAFEGARISMGMRASTGAISEVTVKDEALACRVLGGGEPRGICGSGLVDAVACGLDLGWITPSGRPASGRALPLAGSVQLAPADIRELQLAKGAITAGLRLMVEQLGSTLDASERIHLAGAFGNYISRANARRIGLLPFPPERVEPAGNTALLGAKMVLLRTVDFGACWNDLRPRVEHVPLNEDPRFHEVYVGEMGFPAAD